MSQAYLRFFGELKDFLPAQVRQKTISCRLNGPVAIKHLIEAMGVPHTEVQYILANRASVDFAYLVQPADCIDVYPIFYEIGVQPLLALQPPFPSPPRFILDSHLGQLAAYLRLLGFDTLYRHDYHDEELAQLSNKEQRALLTRDRRLLMRKVVVHGYCLRSKDPKQQLLAVLNRYRLGGQIRPWQRCLRCNGSLQPVDKEVILDRLEPKTKKYYQEFHICQRCEQIYWKGSHYEPLRQFVDEVLAESGAMPEVPEG